jgi:FtsH-binding integral membrane protein
MPENNRLLSIALILVGAAFCLIIPLSIVWPSGWAWHEGGPASNNYFMMIVGVYLTLGLFLIRAAKNPSENASLIWFTVWSSVVHALVMAAESLRSPMQHGHLVGDVPALLIVAVVLGGLMSRTQARERVTAAS